MSIEKLSSNASLKEVMDKFEEISLSDFSSIDIITATELPSKGKEGQVCIITDYGVNNIYLSFNAPELEEKDIYIEISTIPQLREFKVHSSNKVLSIRLKKATQRQGGTYVPLLGYIRVNGEWLSLYTAVYIFKNGEGDITNITEGYVKYTYGSYSSSDTSKVNITSSYIETYATSGSTDLSYATAISNRLIDLTSYSKFKAIISYSSSYQGTSPDTTRYSKVGFSSVKGSSDSFVIYSEFNKNTGGKNKAEIEIDISNLSGGHYFKTYSCVAKGSAKLTIHDAWLEAY